MAEEYIKKEDAIQSVMNHDLLKSDDWSRDWAEYMLEDAPTIDAVPVIRCKDCVHYRVYQLASDGETITDCAVMPCHPPENWYCSNAERKDDE